MVRAVKSRAFTLTSPLSKALALSLQHKHTHTHILHNSSTIFSHTHTLDNHLNDKVEDQKKQKEKEKSRNSCKESFILFSSFIKAHTDRHHHHLPQSEQTLADLLVYINRVQKEPYNNRKVKNHASVEAD
ncbi:hypothetical protein L6452_02745 [Arctium lappa]|uniref:Uncharacterized protein n=1 Tax=Arctium lappa TaxID=4217 RepID=A0ACB9FLA4_ARCLA|nr:hypothetical protein L6452_02745 [Arctium lappa]